MAGRGGSDLPNVAQEFFTSRTIAALWVRRVRKPRQRKQPFFINFNDNHFLNRQYTVYGRVISGMEHVDAIVKGEPPTYPDRMISVKVAADA